MIARIWRGVTKAHDADVYLDVLHRTGLAEYRATPGNLGVLGLRRIAGERAEFLLLTLWESEEAIQRFAGEVIDRSVYYPEDDQYLLEKEERVHHFEVAYQAGWGEP